MASGVTLNYGGYVKIGKIVIVSMQVTTTSAFNTMSQFCSGCPTTAVNDAVLSVRQTPSTVTTARVSGGYIYNDASSLAAGTYKINGAYLTA